MKVSHSRKLIIYRYFISANVTDFSVFFFFFTRLVSYTSYISVGCIYMYITYRDKEA